VTPNKKPLNHFEKPAAVVNANSRIQARVQIKEKPKRVYFAGEGRYCVRHVRGGDIRYDLAEISDPRLPLDTHSTARVPCAHGCGLRKFRVGDHQMSKRMTPGIRPSC
jgi:hypothetical protein